MIVGEYVGFADMDWALGQAAATVPWIVSGTMPNGALTQQTFPDQASAQTYYSSLVAQGATQISMVPGTGTPAATPATPAVPAGTQVIPIVGLGPVRILARDNSPLTRLIATVQARGRILSQARIPSGVFQVTVDKADFDGGLSVEFGAPGYQTIVVSGGSLLCNAGTRNENNVVTAMTTNPCPYQNAYYLDPIQQQAPPPQAPQAAPAPARRPKIKKTASNATEAPEEATTAARAVPTTPSPDHVNQVFAAGGVGQVPNWAWAAGGGVLLLGLVYLFTK